LVLTIIKVKLCVIHSSHQCVIITVCSVKVKSCEVYSHFTVLDLCEAYGCFIALLVGMILTIIKEKLSVIHSPHLFSV